MSLFILSSQLSPALSLSRPVSSPPHPTHICLLSLSISLLLSAIDESIRPRPASFLALYSARQQVWASQIKAPSDVASGSHLKCCVDWWNLSVPGGLFVSWFLCYSFGCVRECESHSDSIFTLCHKTHLPFPRASTLFVPRNTPLDIWSHDFRAVTDLRTSRICDNIFGALETFVVAQWSLWLSRE